MSTLFNLSLILMAVLFLFIKNKSKMANRNKKIKIKLDCKGEKNFIIKNIKSATIKLTAPIKKEALLCDNP